MQEKFESRRNFLGAGAAAVGGAFTFAGNTEAWRAGEELNEQVSRKHLAKGSSYFE